jgi:hypothetical protein
MRVSALLELLIALALLAVPAAVIRALFGGSAGGAASTVGRVLGGALLGLAIAGATSKHASPEVRLVLAYVIYDVATATILMAAGLAGTAEGSLLWPVVAVHTFLAVALISASLSKTSSGFISR